MRIGVVTLSDRASEGTYQDASGPLVCSFLTSWGAQKPSTFLLPDDPEKLSDLLRTLGNESYDLVICTGGTGFASRDTTPETLSRVCDRMIPGFGELLRRTGSLHTPLSYLSRSVAGLLQKTIILCIPGSPNAVQESMPALKDVLPTGIMVARGQNPHEETKPLSQI
jgi:molybdenum cofactor synthesis domain-containing protein